MTDFFTHAWMEREDDTQARDCIVCGVSTQEWRKRAVEHDSLDCDSMRREDLAELEEFFEPAYCEADLSGDRVCQTRLSATGECSNSANHLE